jgi:hypothetical protein
MRRLLPPYPLTFTAVGVLALSFVVLLLIAAEAVPSDGIWRALVIPAYLTMMASAMLRTALPALSMPYFASMLVGIAVCLLPFVALDWLLGRRRSHHVAPAA